MLFHAIPFHAMCAQCVGTYSHIVHITVYCLYWKQVWVVDVWKWCITPFVVKLWGWDFHFYCYCESCSLNFWLFSFFFPFSFLVLGFFFPFSSLSLLFHFITIEIRRLCLMTRKCHTRWKCHLIVDGRKCSKVNKSENSEHSVTIHTVCSNLFEFNAINASYFIYSKQKYKYNHSIPKHTHARRAHTHTHTERTIKPNK